MNPQELLSDEVGFGETREISTVGITGSLTETARTVNFERRWVRGQLGPKDSRSELREKVRPNRKWSTSQREGRWYTFQRRPKRRKCSEGNSGSFKHEGKAKVRARVPLVLDVDHQQETVNKVQAFKKKKCRREPSPSGDKEQPPWHKYLKETCTDPSCDCWHPPDYVKHNTKEGFDFGDKCAFLRRGKKQFAEQEKNKRDRKSDKASVAMVRTFQTVGLCISGY